MILLQDVWESGSTHGGKWFYAIICTWHICEGSGQTNLHPVCCLPSNTFFCISFQVAVIMAITVYRVLFVVNVHTAKFHFILLVLHTSCSYQVQLKGWQYFLVTNFPFMTSPVLFPFDYRKNSILPFVFWRRNISSPRLLKSSYFACCSFGHFALHFPESQMLPRLTESETHGPIMRVGVGKTLSHIKNASYSLIFSPSINQSGNPNPLFYALFTTSSPTTSTPLPFRNRHPRFLSPAIGSDLCEFLWYAKRELCIGSLIKFY